jgi:hypothetical protein
MPEYLVATRSALVPAHFVAPDRQSPLALGATPLARDLMLNINHPLLSSSHQNFCGHEDLKLPTSLSAFPSVVQHTCLTAQALKPSDPFKLRQPSCLVASQSLQLNILSQSQSSSISLKIARYFKLHSRYTQEQEQEAQNSITCTPPRRPKLPPTAEHPPAPLSRRPPPCSGHARADAHVHGTTHRWQAWAASCSSRYHCWC